MSLVDRPNANAHYLPRHGCNADGGIVSFHGAAYPTRMAIVRLADGGLWLWLPIALSSEVEDHVRALGPVRHIVGPNRLHYLFQPL